MLEGYYGDRNAAFKAVAFKGVSDFLKYPRYSNDNYGDI